MADSSSVPLTVGTVAMKYHGTHGDHARDQKAKHHLLASWRNEHSLRGLGTRHFFLMSEDKRNTLVLENSRRMIQALGGQSVWNSMSPEEQGKKTLALMNQIAESLVEEALLQLPYMERRELQVFVWSGCGMHKEMNATKYGNSAMAIEWQKQGMAPVLLANRDNKAVLALHGKENGRANDDDDDDDDDNDDDDDDETEETRGQCPAVRRARKVSKGGARKLGTLLGDLVYNKDPKKGETILS